MDVTIGPWTVTVCRLLYIGVEYHVPSRAIAPEKKEASDKIKMMHIEQQHLEQLIELIRERPALWDVSHPYYKNTGGKPLLWRQIATDLGWSEGR